LEVNKLWETEGHAALSFFSKDFIDCPQKLAHVTGVSHHLYILLTQQFAKFLIAERKGIAQKKFSNNIQAISPSPKSLPMLAYRY
jgi:hypothetical protein